MCHSNPNHRRVCQAALTVALCAVGVAGLVSCGGAQNRNTALRDAVREYADATRWGHIAKAATFVPVAKRAEFLEGRRRAAAAMRILEVDLRGVRLAPDNESAQVIVAIAFTADGSPVIQRHLVEQKWRWQRTGWMLIGRDRVKAPPPTATKPADLY